MNDKQMLEQAIENAKDVVSEIEEQYKIKLEEANKNAKEVVARLEEQHSELYGYKDSELIVLMDLISKYKNKGLTVREIRQKSRIFGSMLSTQVEEAAQSLVDSDELMILTTKNVRGRPRVAYVAKEFANI